MLDESRRDNMPRQPARAHGDADEIYMAESDPDTLSFDEIDASDESLKARDIARAGERATRFGHEVL